MRLTVQTDLSGTVTRQDLTDMWANATVPEVTDDDLSVDFPPIFVGTNFSDVSASLPNPTPGKPFWHQAFGIMYVYHDAIDVMDTDSKTGVSLWLAIGPDSFETAALAAEPIPAGAPVAPFLDRWVKISRPTNDRPIGVNQSGIPPAYEPVTELGETAESGSWIRVAIDGYARFWHPAPTRLEGNPDSAVSPGQIEIDPGAVRQGWVQTHDTDGPLQGSGIGGDVVTFVPNYNYTFGLTAHAVTVPSGYTAAYPFLRFGS